MAEELYDTDFPNLRGLGFERTSEPAYYNCIAYVAGDFRRRWWPGDYHPHMSPDYWPPGVPQEETLEAFVQALATVGYEACDDGNFVPGFEKVTLYAVGGEIRHAALQQDDGTWKSKLASDEDIRHSLEGLEGPLYGKVVAFLRRSRMRDPNLG
jgi:hypothetical protein